YLVMPFHAEGTLERQLTETPKLAPVDVARVGWQLASALAATHARKILHRDLKPSNVLLEDGLKRVRLADFGLAKSHATALMASTGRRAASTVSDSGSASGASARGPNNVAPAPDQ